MYSYLKAQPGVAPTFFSTMARGQNLVNAAWSISRYEQPVRVNCGPENKADGDHGSRECQYDPINIHFTTPLLCLLVMQVY
jgi:hypothetical protein